MTITDILHPKLSSYLQKEPELEFGYISIPDALIQLPSSRVFPSELGETETRDVIDPIPVVYRETFVTNFLAFCRKIPNTINYQVTTKIILRTVEIA